MHTQLTTLLGMWTLGAALGGIFLWWPRLSAAWRLRLAVLSSAAGLVCLILAMNTEGLRESPTVAVFLVGTSYVTEQASASASLPYYALTGLCLLLGVAGLAVGDGLARALSRHWLLTAVGLSVGITVFRFVLEKMAAPWAWTQVVGVTGLAPLVGAYFEVCLRKERKGLGYLVGALLLYGIAVRGSIAALMVFATSHRMGSHYDVSPLTIVRNPFTGQFYSFVPGSVAQILNVGLIPQLLVWPIYTLVAGLLGAGIARLLAAIWGTPPLPAVNPPVRVAEAEPD